ncbi:hypothetical protein [Ferrimonas marina]|uniref:Large polyvalent protein-associated domain-containing protein n=1 Tax=Ferrimonas marina TaxID=299255 RepID=A0A1M5UJP1_9GAMM|nr:hypothetical protein [Ferrimonas marina]SHH63046.1 hypothetical protein SAMN02745129_2598 [Ferrimonas marina]
MMRPLTVNTLVDIAKHSDKVLKLALYLIESRSELLCSKLAAVDAETDPVEALEAFHADLAKTVLYAEKAYQLLSTINPNHDVLHMKGPEKNLVNLFGDRYDIGHREIDFGTFKLGLYWDFDREIIKEQILHNVLGLSGADYERLYKNRNKIWQLNDKELFTTDDKVRFLSVSADYEKHRSVIDKIRQIGTEFIEYRTALPRKMRDKIDNEVTGERAMIDSVVKTSTYISKVEGLEQVSGSHKKEPQLVARIKRQIDESSAIEAIEIDKDASLEAIANALDQIRDLKFDLHKQVIFKVRKLGNYNANGLYSSNYHIVAVDIKNPGALVHEFIHAVDLNREGYSWDPQRQNVVGTLVAEMDEEALREVCGNKRAAYYLNPKEVIARAGEIAYLLQKFDYQQGESMEQFAGRVRKAEQERDCPYDIVPVKPIDTYLNNPHIYFNLSEIPLSKLSLVKGYYESFMGVDGVEPRRNTTLQVHSEGQTVIGEKPAKAKYQLRSVSLFSPDSLGEALRYNQRHGVMDQGDFVEAVIKQKTHVGRTTQRLTDEVWWSQMKALHQMCEFIREVDDPYLNYRFLKAYLVNCPRIDVRPTEQLDNYLSPDESAKGQIDYDRNDILMAMLREPIALNIEDFNKQYQGEIDRLKSELVEAERKSDLIDYRNSPGEYQKQRGEVWELKKDLKSAELKPGMALRNEMNKAVPELQQRYLYMRAENFLETKSKKVGRRRSYSTSILNRAATVRMNKEMNRLCRDILRGAKVEEMLGYLEKEDLLCVQLLQDNSIRAQLPPGDEERKQFDLWLTAAMLENGFIDGVLDNLDSHIIRGPEPDDQYHCLHLIPESVCEKTQDLLMMAWNGGADERAVYRQILVEQTPSVHHFRQKALERKQAEARAALGPVVTIEAKAEAAELTEATAGAPEPASRKPEPEPEHVRVADKRPLKKDDQLDLF